MSETHDAASDSPPAPASRPPVRRGLPVSSASKPPRRERSAWVAWVSLLVCLLVASGPLLSGIRDAERTPGRESAAAQRLTETWRHHQRVDDPFTPVAWTPVADGELRFDLPPGSLWLQLAALGDLEPESTPPDAVRLRARLVSAAMLLLTVAGTFWAAHAIGGVLPASLAAMAVASMPLWLVWGRTAEPAVVTAGWSMLAVGAGMWATRPLRPPPSVPRQVAGWLLCGAALAAAVLCGGLRGLPPAVLPLVIVLALAPHRMGHLLGLLAALVVMALFLTPWALYVHEHDAEAWRTWWTALSPTRWDRPMDYGRLMLERLGMLGVMLLPWTLWIAAGLLQTFSTSTSGSRLRMLIGWVWFVAVAGMLIASPGERSVQPLVLAAPAGGLVVGQLFRRFSDLASGGRFPRLWRWLRWPHLAVLVAATVAAPAAAVFQHDLVRWGAIGEPWVAPMPWQYWLAAALASLGLLAWSAKTSIKHEPARCGVLWGAWGVVFTAFLIGPIARGPMVLGGDFVGSHRPHAVRPLAEQANAPAAPRPSVRGERAAYEARR